ncbi:hypothetical protein RvY_01452 [Ramazzottius varieornatus]|uniref:Uncharacterized protein n=1 Tax=Ramazzottius varieornatus TaxID=947166 RepID=A0A1D1UK99_RAMVA|nr:hypothetical protein RvY_01452 [Ramazzottius varieornatus]
MLKHHSQIKSIMLCSLNIEFYDRRGKWRFLSGLRCERLWSDLGCGVQIGVGRSVKDSQSINSA